MKKYVTLGELIKDYRMVFRISQADFASKLNADIRTIQRWEKDETNIKTEKEAEFVRITLLPFQLVRNLNSTDPIPTFYDFSTRKYSLTELSNEMPDALWFKMNLDEITNRIRTIDIDVDFEYITAFTNPKKSERRNLYQVLKQAIVLVPELNFIILDATGNYAGFSINAPIKSETFELLKSTNLSKEQVTVDNLVNYNFVENPVFFELDITADCNDNINYIVTNLLSFFKNLECESYTYCGFTKRPDTYNLHQQLGLKIVWEEENKDNGNIWELPTRFVAGDFKSFLS